MTSKKIIKIFTSKKGNQVTIRYIQKNDLEDLLKFANDLIAEDTFIMLSGNKITREQEEKYLNEILNDIENNKKIYLAALVNDKFAGTCEIRRFDMRKNHVGEVGISLSAPYREEGIGTIFLQTLIDEGKKLGLKLLVLHCFENNERAFRVYEKLGFKRAGVVPGVYEYQEDYIGEVIFYLSLK